ncbi:MAG: acyltransferase [Chloroflexi bacterium]|nr:acyltransferase [Chloroflexota bacterium]
MQLVRKKILKLLAKQMPIHQLRAVLLRSCGYTIGRDAFVGEDLIIVDELSDNGLVRIGDRAAISPRVTLVVSSRPNSSRIAPFAPVKHGPVVIENDAWLGTGVVVLPNVTIGEGAIVGANSVVAVDVKPYTIVAGLPARTIGTVPVP